MVNNWYYILEVNRLCFAFIALWWGQVVKARICLQWIVFEQFLELMKVLSFGKTVFSISQRWTARTFQGCRRKMVYYLHWQSWRHLAQHLCLNLIIHSSLFFRLFLRLTLAHRSFHWASLCWWKMIYWLLTWHLLSKFYFFNGWKSFVWSLLLRWFKFSFSKDPFLVTGHFFQLPLFWKY